MQHPYTRPPQGWLRPSSSNGDIPIRAASGAFWPLPPLSLFPLHLQRLNRFGLFNLLGENQPSFSRRSELFALQPVTCGFILRSAISRHSAAVNRVMTSSPSALAPSS